MIPVASDVPPCMQTPRFVKITRPLPPLALSEYWGGSNALQAMPLDEAEEEFEMIVVTRTELIVESNKAVKLDESPVTTWQPLELGAAGVRLRHTWCSVDVYIAHWQ